MVDVPLMDVIIWLIHCAVCIIFAFLFVYHNYMVADDPTFFFRKLISDKCCFYC